ncbi:hypothetical protein BT69DRAFT_1277621 [Atractiella rhizophila]|nr:hypothetical protein BT69DRAFT_1277621 [Atractiella rhizophila]
MLGQADIGKYLDRCTSDQEVEEVLSGYVIWKYLRGHTSGEVLEKIRYLTLYLRGTNRSHILTKHNAAFLIICYETALGGGRIGYLPAMTPAGKDICNRIRSHANKSNRFLKRIAFVTHSEFAGPFPVDTITTQDQRGVPTNDREPWSERYFQNRPRLNGSLQPAPDYHLREGTDHAGTLPEYASRGPAYSEISMSDESRAQLAQIPLQDNIDDGIAIARRIQLQTIPASNVGRSPTTRSSL